MHVAFIHIGVCSLDKHTIGTPTIYLRRPAAVITRPTLWCSHACLVARQLTANDTLAAHAGDELRISEITTARPVQAALTWAATFFVRTAIRLLMVVVARATLLVAIGAWAGGAIVLRAIAPITFWGMVAMAPTADIGTLFGAIVRRAAPAVGCGTWLPVRIAPRLCPTCPGASTTGRGFHEQSR